MSSLNCLGCNYTTTVKCNFDRHLTSEKHKLYTLTLEHNNLKKVADDKIKIVEHLEQVNKELTTEIKFLKESSRKFEIIAEKAATRPTTNNNNSGNTKTTNNILQILSPHPLDVGKFQEAVARQFSTELILRGTDAVANVILAGLKDADGRYQISCTDLSRQNFQYKDSDGEMKSDPQLITLMGGLRETTKDKYKKDIHMKLYDAAHITMDKKGELVLDDDYLFELRDTALFKSKKVVTNIARKTYTKNNKAKIVFED